MIWPKPGLSARSGHPIKQAAGVSPRSRSQSVAASRIHTHQRMEARVAIAPFRPGFLKKSTRFAELLKHYLS